jgi:hypothetical protein
MEREYFDPTSFPNTGKPKKLSKEDKECLDYEMITEDTSILTTGLDFVLRERTGSVLSFGTC